MTLHQTRLSHGDRVRQGDIYTNIPYYESYKETSGEFELSVFEFPFVLVLTQDCDLEQNKTNRTKVDSSPKDTIALDKHLISVIVVPLYNSEHLLSGEHLDLIGIKTQKYNTEQKNLIKTNQNQRYHYIEFGDEVSIPNSVVDFKHYFTASLDYLENNSKNYICGISPIYRELISQRFSNYLSRIGLPEITSS